MGGALFKVCRAWCVSIGLACLGTPLLAQGAANNHLLRYSETHGIRFSEIRDIGNAPYMHEIVPGGPPTAIGQVNYAFRLSTTEVTASQWFGFVQAYAPQLPRFEAPPPEFVGIGALWQGYDADGIPVFTLDSARANRPDSVGWRYAARFANWLHNGGPASSEATSADFETGAYSTSSFGGSPQEGYTDQAIRSPGAQFWIPNWDEWTKGVYYDPSIDGNRTGGYWQHPDSGNEPLASGPPSSGGETNAGLPCLDCPIDVGSYVTTHSPWGLLDASGGQREWLEDYNALQTHRLTAGSRYRDAPYVNLDTIGSTMLAFPSFGQTGFRIAASIPSPGPSLCSVIAMMTLHTATIRRRRS